MIENTRYSYVRGWGLIECSGRQIDVDDWNEYELWCIVVWIESLEFSVIKTKDNYIVPTVGI